MTPSPDRTALAELASFATPPCLSLCQTTHRSHPDNLQDPIRYRQGLNALEVSLRQQHSAAEARQLLEPFEALAQDDTGSAVGRHFRAVDRVVDTGLAATFRY